MRVLSLFAGLDGQGAAFRDRGHEVITYDMDLKFAPDVLGDLSEVWQLPKADVALVGFPCNCFSVASFGHHWTGGYRAYEPKTEEAKRASGWSEFCISPSHIFTTADDSQRTPVARA